MYVELAKWIVSGYEILSLFTHNLQTQWIYFWFDYISIDLQRHRSFFWPEVSVSTQHNIDLRTLWNFNDPILSYRELLFLFT